MSQYTIDNGTNLSNNTNSFNVQNVQNVQSVQNYYVADDRSQLLTWLSPLEPRLRHRDIQERRVDNVGEWLLQTEEFRRWHGWSGEGDKAVLFCYGGPGVGKTFLGSLVVDRLCDQARGKNTAVACFYFDFAARKEQSTTNMLGSLLKQVVGGMEKIPEEVSGAFQDQKSVIGGRAPRLPDLVKMLQAVTSSRPMFVCIDALDECAAVHRLLNSLQQILEKSPHTRIFITGRPYIQAEVEKRLAGRVISVPVGPTRNDITEYIRARLDEDETPDAIDENLEAGILEKIPQNMSEMFLLVSLNIDSILDEPTISGRREKLSKMAAGPKLEDVYGATIERIRAQSGGKSRLGMAALMWTSHAERPLQADELCHALAVQLDSTEFDVSNVPSMPTLLSCCQGLITVDKEASTARLIHYTLQEYLSSHHDIFSSPHSAIAEICLTYLNSQQVKTLSTAPCPNTQNTPFLEYCSVYWGIHAKRTLSDYGRSLALTVLNGDYGRISTELLLAGVKDFPSGRFDTLSPFSGLHCASFFGIVELVAGLAEMEYYNVNEEDFSRGGPLAWASHNGHSEVVKYLLGREGVDPDMTNKYGQTPLSFAAKNGHDGVVKMLLGREEVNSDKPDNDGRTPLSFAAWNGREGVVKILLGREEVNPDKPDNDGRTPLRFAARYGYEGVVKMLLEQKEVNPDKPDNDGQTPLSSAAWNGHEGVVKILLGCEEVSPDSPTDNGQTPLWYAALAGHEGVVRILLDHEEVDPDRPDNDGNTPLWAAAWFGRDGGAKILLDREEVNPDKPNRFGKTPLSKAAEAGHEGVVRVLLGREEVHPNKPNNSGQSPLRYAASGGNKRVIALLQAHDKAIGPGAT